MLQILLLNLAIHYNLKPPLLRLIFDALWAQSNRVRATSLDKGRDWIVDVTEDAKHAGTTREQRL